MKKYRVILADPPWSYRNGGNGAAKNHYRTMTDKDIMALPVSTWAQDDAVLLLWATWPKLDVAMRVIESWDFKFVTGFPWIKLQKPPLVTLGREFEAKPAFGTGFWVRGCTEPILIAKRGKAKHPPDTWLGLISERFKHSRKPNNLYEYAESFGGPYLELFARRPWPGWDSWGNEVNSVKLIDNGN